MLTYTFQSLCVSVDGEMSTSANILSGRNQLRLPKVGSVKLVIITTSLEADHHTLKYVM